MRKELKNAAIAALFAAISFAAQADLFNWTIQDVTVSGGNELSATSQYKAYLFASELTGGTYSDISSKITTIDAVTSLLAKKQDISGNALDSATSAYNSSFGDSSFSGSSILSGTQFAQGTTLSCFAVIIDSLNVSDAQKYMIAHTSKGNEPYIWQVTSSEDGSAQTQTFSWTGGSTSGAAWVSIPEPTSGLLLVLGMATLALKRRRV